MKSYLSILSICFFGILNICSGSKQKAFEEKLFDYYKEGGGNVSSDEAFSSFNEKIREALENGKFPRFDHSTSPKNGSHCCFVIFGLGVNPSAKLALVFQHENGTKLSLSEISTLKDSIHNLFAEYVEEMKLAVDIQKSKEFNIKNEEH